MKRYLYILFLVQSIGFAQEVAIEMTTKNTLFKGVQNPILVTVENTDCKDIIISSENAKIIQSDHNACANTIVPDTISKVLTINVYKKESKDTILVDKKVYRLLDVPDPILDVSGLTEGEVPKKTFKNRMIHGRMSSYLDPNIACAVFKITEFTLMVIRDQNVIGISKNIGNRATDETKQLVELIKSGDKVYIVDIKCQMLSEIRELDEIKFDIK